ncbi:NAD(P)/FAD-dependent oxidoreductase [Amycolatopsis xylanica]|nr:FAD-dependent oxidoreductase [Amycolatopsis xylanica]
MVGNDERFVLIGGGPAALSAARAYREAGGSGQVRILSADTEAPYFRPPLSKEFLRGDATDDDLPIESPEFYRDQRIDLSLRTEVTALDTEARTVTTSGGEVIDYTTCLLATGSEPARPPIPGADHPDVLTLRTAADSRRLREAADGVRSAVVVGAGFIGCEAAASLSRLGLQVTMICPEPFPQHARLGEDAGRELARWLKLEGVSVLTGTELLAIEDGTRIRTDLIPVLDVGFVLLATGVQPRVELAEKAGLDIGKGRVRTDEHLRASARGVFAAGDLAFAHNTAAARALKVEHWGEAEKMGGIAGRTAAGAPAAWDSVPGFWSTIGDRTLKYAAWGDGFDEARFIKHDNGFTVWYGRGGTTVGVLTHEADDDYERGSDLVERGAPLTEVVSVPAG